MIVKTTDGMMMKDGGNDKKKKRKETSMGFLRRDYLPPEERTYIEGRTWTIQQSKNYK